MSKRDAPVALVCVKGLRSRSRRGTRERERGAHATWITPRILEVPRIIARARAARVCDGRAATLRRFRGDVPSTAKQPNLPSAIFPEKNICQFWREGRRVARIFWRDAR